jgi:hypothetical protein
MMLVGIMSALSAGATSPLSLEESRPMRAHAFDLIAAATATVRNAMWFAARSSARDGIVYRMPPRIDPQYETHPPVSVRDEAKRGLGRGVPRLIPRRSPARHR